MGYAMMNLAQSSAYVMFVFVGHNRKMSCHANSFRSMPTISTARTPRDVLASGEIKVDVAVSLTQQYYESLSGDFTSCDSNEFFKGELNEDMDDIEGFSVDEDTDNHLFFQIQFLYQKICISV
jgi:hypothetical protein